ncbi:hypothetical protein DFH09DRAFT_804356, partial [Mycena vulgaris]
FVSSIFGAIHCAAWNTDFPSTDEMWMWKACSLMFTAIPMLLAAFLILDATTMNNMTDTIFSVILLAVVLIYIIARLFLIIFPFTALHTLPPGAFAD